MQESNILLENLKKAEYGTHLIVPLKYKHNSKLFSLNEKDIKNTVFYKKKIVNEAELNGNEYTVNGSDLNEMMGKLFNKHHPSNIALSFIVDEKDFIKYCFNADNCKFFIDDTDCSSKKDSGDFKIDKVMLYVFTNGVAFICLSFTYEDIGVMRKIFDPSYVKLKRQQNFYYTTKGDSYHSFSFKEFILKLLDNTDFDFFFPVNDNCVFSDSYALSLAVIPERIKDLDLFKKITFNLQRMYPLEYNEFDSFVIALSSFAYPNQKDKSYQWCSNIGDCSISRVRCGDTFEHQTQDFRANSLTLVILSLYQKYSSLLFTEQLQVAVRKRKKNFDILQNAMIDFKTFGEVPVANVSRIASVRNFYRQILDVNGVNEALNEIDIKLKVIAERERELNDSKLNAVMIILSLFGIVSIVADMISVVQSISSGGSLEWTTAVLTVAGIFMITAVAIFFKRKV